MTAPSDTAPAHKTRLATMARLGLAMMLHDKLKLAGTLLGVVFAVLLADQQLGTFLGLLQKNTMFVDQASVDVWIGPAGTESLQTSHPLSTSALAAARVTPGVAWAEPLLMGNAMVSLPDGGAEAVTLIGTRFPRFAGGPWNMVAGSVEALHAPDALVFEDSQRVKLGGLNLGSRREVNGHRVTVGGFTWGLLPFGPSFAFAEYDTARMVLGGASDHTSFVVVKLERGARASAVQRELARRLPGTVVLTRDQMRASTIRHVLARTPIGITFSVSTLFGLLVGFVIVSLLMFSAVVDHVREFGTLKAIGATNADLAKLLVTQAIAYALAGSAIGLFLVTRVADGIRSPSFGMVLPSWLVGATPVAMTVLCVVASVFALIRLRKVEPGMVFR